MIGSNRFKRNRTEGEPEQRFISAEEFAASTGMSIEQVINQYCVLRDGIDVVPQFIADDWTADPETHANQISIEDHDNTVTSSLTINLDESFDDDFPTSDYSQKHTVFGESEEPYHTNESDNVLSTTHDVNAQPETSDDPIERVRLRLKQMGSHFRASPGIRFWARFVDLAIPYGLLCVGFQFALTHTTALKLIPNPTQVAAILFLLFPAALLLDSLIHTVFGNTFGKSIAGVRVVNESGNKLTFSRYLMRDFAMWLQGLAMLLPPLFLVTLLVQYSHVRRDRSSTYDRNSGVNVLQDPTGALQKLGFALAVVGSTLAIILIMDTVGSYALDTLQPWFENIMDELSLR